MAQPLDPYHRWLGISAKDQPANHYRLLAIDLFESDPEVIRDAAERQMAHVRTYQLGQHSAISQKILNEIGAAKACLLSAEKKAEYDRMLRGQLASAPSEDQIDVGFTIEPVSAAKVPRKRREKKQLRLVPGVVALVVLFLVGFAIVWANRGTSPTPAESDQLATTPPPPPSRAPEEPPEKPSASPQPQPANSGSAKPAHTEPEIPKPPTENPATAPAEPERKPADTSQEPQLSTNESSSSSNQAIEPRSQPEAEKRSNIPDQAALQKAAATIRGAFQDDYAKPTQKFAKKLLQDAQGEKDAVLRFALLQEAKAVAAKIGEIATAFQAIEAMAQGYGIAAAQAKAEFLEKIAALVRTPAQRSEFADEAVKAIDEAIAEDDFATARLLGKLALAQARQLRQTTLSKEVVAKIKQVDTVAKAFEETQAALATLEREPDNARAKTIAGKYYCFTKGDWRKGLPLLAAGDDPQLKALAGEDLDGPSDAQQQMKLGDNWWNSAETQSAAATRHLQARAGYWYQKALPGLTGLTKDKVQRRLAQTQPSRPRIGREEKEIAFDLGGVKLELVLIRPGSFMMGDQSGASHEKPVHKVTITQPFYIGKYEVTQQQWKAVMANNPSRFPGPRNPVDTISRDDCQAFLEKLNEKFPATEGSFALPSEAQWEYACRAGSATRYCCGDGEASLGDYAWFDRNAETKTHPVGEKKPNAWGLYDTHGNVWEWCADWYDEGYYKTSAPRDPTGPSSASYGVLRGGSWDNTPEQCRSGVRQRFAPAMRLSKFGFRVARTLY